MASLKHTAMRRPITVKKILFLLAVAVYLAASLVVFSHAVA